MDAWTLVAAAVGLLGVAVGIVAIAPLIMDNDWVIKTKAREAIGRITGVTPPDPDERGAEPKGK